MENRFTDVETLDIAQEKLLSSVIMLMHPPFLSSRSGRYSTSIPAETPSPSSIDSAQSIAGDGLSATIGFLVLTSSFILLLFSMRNWKTARETPTFSEEVKKWSDKLVFELPCRHCQYFSANRYLPCAVNPEQVLTTQAINCRDFQQKETY